MEKEKWAALYQAHHERVLAYLTAKVGSRETAEDLCMEVFEQAYRSFHRFDESKSSFKTWLFTIVRYTLTDHYRTLHAAELIEQEAIQNQLVATDEPEADLLREETLSLLGSALRKLEREEREIIVLRYERGWTLTQIAERTGISYGMTKVKHRAALNKLRRALDG